MRFGETLRYNANTEWWDQYLRYNALKKRIKVLRALRRKIITRHPIRGQALIGSDTGAESSESGTLPVEGQSLEAQAESSEDEAPAPMHRSASRAVLANLERMAEAEALPEPTLTARPRAVIGALTPDAGAESEEDGEKNLPNFTFDELVAQFQTLEDEFVKEVEAEVRKIERFYKEMKLMLPQVGDRIKQDACTLRAASQARARQLREADESSPLLPFMRPFDPVTASASLRNDLELQFRDIRDLLVYCDLNSTGLSKILKKHDKNIGTRKRPVLVRRFKENNEFYNPEFIHSLQAQTVQLYADNFTGGDEIAAKRQLEQWDKRLVTFDKDTMWRSMLRVERKVSAFHMKGQVAPGTAANPHLGSRPKYLPLAVALGSFLVLMTFPQLVRSLPPKASVGKYSLATLDAANRCAALLCMAIILWATEALPLYVTSLIVIPASSVLQLYLDKKGNPLSTTGAAKQVFNHMSSSTIMLVICVYALGAALSKFGIDKAVAIKVMSRIKVAEVLVLSVMVLSVLLSMFVSNVAAPVLLISVLLPVIQDMPPNALPCVRCILFSIMIGSNIGGFASPISSPQSAVALGLLAGRYRISFMQWLKASLPLCLVMVLITFGMLMYMFEPQKHRLPPIHRQDDKFNWRHYVIIVTVAVTVLLWAIHRLSEAFGSAGMVAAVPLVIFFGTDILRKEDFNNLPWDVVYLVAGGIVLGSAVESSQLLSLIVERVLFLLGDAHLWRSYMFWCCFMAVIANAVSHTVSAIIVLPLIYEVGRKLGHPQLLVMGGTIAASSAMALPVSSFPNISVAQVTDEGGDPYLTNADLLNVGIPATVACTIVIVTAGYWVMTTQGF